MKKAILILGCILLINSINCFSQSDEKNKKEFRSKTKYVCGYSNEFKDAISMGITFGKVISPTDTTYYIKFDLYSPYTEYRTDICLNRDSVITFLAKSGRSVDLKLSKVRASLKSDDLTNDPRSTTLAYDFSTTLILEVTKEELINIGSEPFYKLILPYFNCASKINSKVEFFKPSIFTPRIFTQKNINYIFDI